MLCDLGRVAKLRWAVNLEQQPGFRLCQEETTNMAWTKPILKEIACGMEINMYAPAEDEPVLF